MGEIAFGCLSGATPKTCDGFNLIWHAGVTVRSFVPADSLILPLILRLAKREKSAIC
jgi:hypothetical protein